LRVQQQARQKSVRQMLAQPVLEVWGREQVWGQQQAR
jgi:hypothetical protein